MRDRNRGYERQEQNFYPTPAWVTEALLRTVRLPKGIWEPCCGNGAMARVLESHGHHVVGTDLVDRGYGEGGRDVLMESRLPDGVTAIVTNPPYGGALARRVVDHALELMLPVGGMVALLMNVQWQTAKTNSARCRIPAFDASVILTDRIRWIPDTDVRGSENHCWMVWDFSRTPGRASVDGPRRQAALLGHMPEARQPPGRGPAPHGVRNPDGLFRFAVRPHPARSSTAGWPR
jgi:hypothetical protein